MRFVRNSDTFSGLTVFSLGGRDYGVTLQYVERFRSHRNAFNGTFIQLECSDNELRKYVCFTYDRRKWKSFHFKLSK